MAGATSYLVTVRAKRVPDRVITVSRRARGTVVKGLPRASGLRVTVQANGTMLVRSSSTTARTGKDHSRRRPLKI